MAAKKETTKSAAKTAGAAVKTTAPKAEENKTEAKKVETPVKADKPAEKKETVKKTPARKASAKKAELKAELHIQFSGKSYAEEDLMNMVRDVWKYDLNQEPDDLASVELYVKPEENVVYYVMNKEFTGSFKI